MHSFNSTASLETTSTENAIIINLAIISSITNNKYYNNNNKYRNSDNLIVPYHNMSSLSLSSPDKKINYKYHNNNKQVITPTPEICKTLHWRYFW